MRNTTFITLLFQFVMFFSIIDTCHAAYNWKDISIPLRENIKVEGSVTIQFEVPKELLENRKTLKLDITTWDLDSIEVGFIQIGTSWFSGYYSITGDDGKRVSDSIEIDVDDLVPGTNTMRIGNRVAKYRYFFWIKELKFNADFNVLAKNQNKVFEKQESRNFSVNEINKNYIATGGTFSRKGPDITSFVIFTVNKGDILQVTGKVIEKNWYQVAHDGYITSYVHADFISPYNPQHITQKKTKKKIIESEPIEVPRTATQKAAQSMTTSVTTKKTPQPAKQEVTASVKRGSRVALIVGNSNYQNAALKNPVNDSNDMAVVLQDLGFEVIKQNDVDRRGMLTSLDSFAKKLRRAEIGLFYYAGHGMQMRGINYLIPVNTNITSAADVEYEGFNASRIISKMAEAGTNLNIVILDACRNNPFRSLFRSSARGLLRMEVPVGTIIAYATSPGDVAADGTGRNGLYTKHLMNSLQSPGLNIQEIFNKAGLEVMRETNMSQVPWFNSSPMEPMYLSGKK